MRFLGAIFVLVMAGDLASAQEPSFKITGVVKQLDLKGGTIAIRSTRKGVTEDETFGFLKKDIDVLAPTGQKTRLDAIKIGQTVVLTIGILGDVETVAIQAFAFRATVADVDVSRRTIKIAPTETGAATLPVAEHAKLSIAGKPVFLREIKPGSEMTVSTSLDGKTVLGLNLLSDPDGKLATKLYPRVKTSRLPGTRLVGVLSDIDPAKKELNLTGPKTKNIPRRLTLAQDALIQVIYWQVPMQELTLREIGKTAQATVMVSADDRATRILIEPPTQVAKATALDGDAGRLTVEIEGSKKTYSLRPGIKVMNGTRVMRLSDVHPNLAVNLILSLDREQVLAIDLRGASD